jgi:hypothetical protein
MQRCQLSRTEAHGPIFKKYYRKGLPSANTPYMVNPQARRGDFKGGFEPAKGWKL